MIDRFLSDVPFCISKFEVFHKERSEEYSIIFGLQCSHCKSREYKILCYPIVAEDDDTYEGFEAGQIVERSPHHLECSNCKRRELLFDPEVHGYDGAMGFGSSYERGEGEEKVIALESIVYQVKVEFLYQIDFDELKQIAEESNVRPQDLFDGFAIHAVRSDGAIIKTLGFECA